MGSRLMLAEDLLAAPVLEPAQRDLDQAARVTYLLQQTFRYDYPAPIEQLRQRLVVLPPAQHGAQLLRAHRLEVLGSRVRRQTRSDSRGNTVVRLHAERVEQSIEFRVQAVIERVNPDGGPRLPLSVLSDPRLLRATALTGPDEALRELAASIDTDRNDPIATADAVCRTVHSALTYEYGVTSVQSTAAEALAAGRGVCQDSAHIMLALCHLLALPARYVSGHLLGQGGTHAWVEVLVPDGGPGSGAARALAFDPCNGVPGSARYLTVATGRDYADVAPTSGTFVGSVGGELTTSRRLGVLQVA